MAFFKTQAEFDKTFRGKASLKTIQFQASRKAKKASRDARKASHKATMHRILGGAASKFQSLFK